MTPEQLDYIIYALWFFLGYSVSELLSCFGIAQSIKKIAEAQERFVKWAEKEDKR